MKASYRLVSLADMMQLELGKLLDCTVRATHLSQHLTGAPQGKNILFAKHDMDMFMASCEAAEGICQRLGFSISARALRNLLHDFRARLKPSGQDFVIEAGVSLRIVCDALTIVVFSLGAETSSSVALLLEDRQLQLLEPKSPLFGEEVALKFRGAAYDISESGKCLALGRSTAAVFHLMRVLELALKAVHACLGLAAPVGRNWTDWLIPIREERMRRGGTKWSKNDFFQDVWQRLDSIKDSQRNGTMHVESIYTEEEARVIFDATKLFMQRIASQMDERGEPMA